MTMTTCSTASLEVHEATIGSAPTARAWVCLEQPGPWGPRAFTSSRLDPQVGKAFEEAASTVGVRPQLIRSPGRHPVTDSASRTILIAYTAPGSSWLLQGEVDRPERILELDFATIASGIEPDWPELKTRTEPLLLVCTNGKRDVCCANLGRDVALHAHSLFPGRIWEASHLSGHRFAATTALFPSGHMHGRVLDGSVVLAAADRGELVSTGWRGRSTWEGAAQAAELAIREREGLWGLDDFTVIPESSGWRVTASKGSWLTEVEKYFDGQAPPSCGKASEPVRQFKVAIQ